ncbi:MAG: choice-of-anchor Q domain-containing protein, partial [Kiritimatiellae bacterium]|nr:choice-of-anchor Q domain-containing protein [Kiritimatiellia bacterium]
YFGGGVLARTGTTISNCVITGCAAGCFGGGVCSLDAAPGVTMYDCEVANNTAGCGGSVNGGYGGGVGGASTLYNCTIIDNTCAGGTYCYGGGVSVVTALYNCKIIHNGSIQSGLGGFQVGALYNCLIFQNYAMGPGGQAIDATTLYNCTIVGNWTGSGSAGVSGNCTLNNCISWGNQAADAPKAAYYSCGLGYDSGLYSGNRNIVSDPLFVNASARDYRLRAASPCINTGTNGTWTVGTFDLDGRLRARDGAVDMGAYEFVKVGTLLSIL